jgi:aminoglycoside 3-N-acetyltransferase
VEGDKPSGHGPNSSWKFCHDHDAIVIGLGVYLDHYNTMLRVADEAFGDWKWNDEEWFVIKKFNVIDEDDNKFYIEVKDRKPFWGMKHLAENYYVHEVKKMGIIQETLIDGIIPVCFERSTSLIKFLRSKNKNGYPYFKWNLLKK